MRKKFISAMCVGAVALIGVGAGCMALPLRKAVADYSYQETQNGVILTQVNKAVDGNLVLPSEIDGKAVVEIGSGIFDEVCSITSLTVPQSVQKIAFGAFSGMKYLEELIIPFVGGSANAVGAEKTLGYVFGDTAGSGAYTLQQYSETESAVYYLPYSLSKINVQGGSLGYGSFYGCKSLQTVTMSASITEIPAYAFRGTTALETVVLPDSTVTIGEKAFYNSSLKTINLDKVQTIEASAFVNTKLTNLTLTNVQTIGNQAFSGVEKLSALSLGDCLTAIGDYAFAYCSLLKEVNLPASVASVGKGAFYQNLRLAAVNYSGMNLISEDGVLYNADKTQLIVYPAGKTGASFTLPATVRSICENAFNGNKSLKTITVNAETQEIGYAAFSACPSLTSLNVYFHGASASATGAQALLGYVFGETPFEGCKIEKATVEGVTYYYCLPANVTVTVLSV